MAKLLHLNWFYMDWWKYLLMKPRSWTAFWCRSKGHPYEVWWYNPGGSEPDMHCKNCDDDLG